ncbi:MAG: hypothetical protein PUP90_23990 [Nostoc sp. S4]|nr:hypothetical protein [Nostoc sp. S4]
MRITLSQQALDELFQETVEPLQHPDPDDVLDVMYKYPRQLGWSYWQEIYLPEGLELIIGNLQLPDRITYIR